MAIGRSRRIRKGAAMLVSMIILAALSAWAVSVCCVSNVNLQLAENQRKADAARASAESGLEVMRFWLGRFSVPGTTDPGQVFDLLASSFADDLSSNGVYNICPTYDGSTITVPAVTLDSQQGRFFTARIRQADAATIELEVTGHCGSISKTIRVNYNIGERAHSVFDYGVATRGALHLSGNVELEGVNVSVESDVFIESANSNLALSIIGNSHIAGEVSIANPLATVDIQGGQASIGGEKGDDALNHVFIGVDPPEFPTPNPSAFAAYATNVIDASTDTSSDATFENVRIAAGTNPTFNGNVELKGIVFIETPNVVTFAGNAEVTGIVVGDGNVEDNSATNQINFLGTVVSHGVEELQGAQFAGLQDQTGTFLLAPGFHVSFGGNFHTLNGAVAANGIEFFGNAGGTINGSVINYSDVEMTLSGNSDLYFNRSGVTEVPAGFVPEIVLEYDPSSYCEVTI